MSPVWLSASWRPPPLARLLQRTSLLVFSALTTTAEFSTLNLRLWFWIEYSMFLITLWIQIWALNPAYKGPLGQIPGTYQTHHFLLLFLFKPPLQWSSTISFALPWPLDTNHTGPSSMLFLLLHSYPSSTCIWSGLQCLEELDCIFSYCLTRV